MCQISQVRVQSQVYIRHAGTQYPCVYNSKVWVRTIEHLNVWLGVWPANPNRLGKRYRMQMNIPASRTKSSKEFAYNMYMYRVGRFYSNKNYVLIGFLW